MEPLPGWAARLAEAARRPVPAPKRRLALPKAASYYTGQLWRRALPIPPVGPPPSELRRASTSKRPDRLDRAGRRPRSLRPVAPRLARTAATADTWPWDAGLAPAGSARWCPAATPCRAALDTGGPRRYVHSEGKMIKLGATPRPKSARKRLKLKQCDEAAAWCNLRKCK